MSIVGYEGTNLGLMTGSKKIKKNKENIEME